MPTTAELIAAHLAKKGATKVAAGEGHGFTDRQWYAAARGNLDLNAKIAGADSEREAERVREKFAEARAMGVSQDLAYRYATGQVSCCCCDDMNGRECK